MVHYVGIQTQGYIYNIKVILIQTQKCIHLFKYISISE